MITRTFIALAMGAGLALGTASTSAAKDTDAAQDAAMAQALAALDAAMPGSLINNPYAVEWRTEGGDHKSSVVKSEGVPGNMAYRVRIKKTKPNAWDTAARLDMSTDIAKDDVILVSFWARAHKVAKGKEAGRMQVALQRNVEPYDQIILEDIAPGPDWKLYNVAGTAARDYTAKKTNLNFNLAKAKQTIEFGPFYIMSLGKGTDPTPYLK